MTLILGSPEYVMFPTFCPSTFPHDNLIWILCLHEIQLVTFPKFRKCLMDPQKMDRNVDHDDILIDIVYVLFGGVRNQKFLLHL
ncbi:CLUMA_CG011397, isoform A [Clunio marinus]|uniref:CLUMA_CG011397, isoform A n=1 Tax=Clunio marinus TaxID=568069 RepID=A0A1J1IEP6_9DIPT|nr:CLUMA_CG011397, isoform A [Clunio marinus]